jgi:multicomponent Na+:H+ antiporter subunit G
VFVLLTAPVAAHMIGRAAYLTGVPLWEKTVCDELREQRHEETSSPDDSQGPPDSR